MKLNVFIGQCCDLLKEKSFSILLSLGSYALDGLDHFDLLFGSTGLLMPAIALGIHLLRSVIVSYHILTLDVGC